MLRWIGWNLEAAVLRSLPQPVRRWMLWRLLDHRWAALERQSRRRR